MKLRNKTFILILFAYFLMTNCIFSERIEQNDWLGISGVLGPVSSWETNFNTKLNVSVAIPGKISLIATDWDYLSWDVGTLACNPDIQEHTQGLMPADIDNDGDNDVIGIEGNEAKWYENMGDYVFVPHNIGVFMSTVRDFCCSYPVDLDGDGDIDVLIAGSGIVGGNCGWFENEDLGTAWTWHLIDSTASYHRISAADFDMDGDVDILAADNAHSSSAGDIYVFFNNGSCSFTKVLVANPSADNNGWRVYPGDFNDDGFPDFYSSGWQAVYFYINDGTGNFSPTDSMMEGASGWDGAWAEDIDMDGDIDLVASNVIAVGSGSSPGFHAFLNDGSGTSFTETFIITDDPWSYGDGSVGTDIDLDGNMDICGSYRKVGWFRQNPTSPMTFTEFMISDLVSEFGLPDYIGSHWIYPAKLSEKCIPSLDLLITMAGFHLLFANNIIVSFASSGYLESSIIDIGNPVIWRELGWDACIPYENSIAFYWRAGNDASTLTSLPWIGPIQGEILNTPDSADINGFGRYFQYRIEFNSESDFDDIATLYRIWAEYGVPPNVAEIQYNEETDCDGINTVDICYTIDSPDSIPADISIEFSDDGGVSWTISPTTVTDAEGDLGSNVSAGEHCFNWILSTDLPGIESDAWKVRIVSTVFGASDTAYYSSPLDSRPPDVNIFQYPSQIAYGDSAVLNWSVEDLFWSHRPGTLSIICGADTIDTVLSDTFFVWHPDWSTISCDSAIFRIVMRDSFCNWGADTCAISLCPDVVPPEIIPIDTLSECFDFNFTMKFMLYDSIAGIDYSSISVTLDSSAIAYELVGDTIIITGGDSIFPRDTGIVCISVSDANTICPPNDTSRCWLVWRCPLSFGCLRMPNPFTPNGDNIHDLVYFRFPNMGYNEGKIYLYDVHNVLVNTINVPSGGNA